MGESYMRKEGKRIFTGGVCGMITIGMLSGSPDIYAIASDGTTVVEGLVYTFEGDDSHYEISDADKAESSLDYDTYGEFSISGEITDIYEIEGVPAYEVEDGFLSFYYNYSDSMLNAGDDVWHLTSDNTKKIDGETLDSKIKNGAIRIQVSKDQINWTDESLITNVFEDIPVNTDSIYTTTEVQLLNGCYYRVTVVYELELKEESRKMLGQSIYKSSYRKMAEVYEFYVSYQDVDESIDVDATQTYSLGSRIKVKNSSGYNEELEIDNDDSHYGWNLGNFFVSGYTDEVTDSDGNVVFLKNVGDTVTLWFNLEQDIDALNGDTNLSITDDEKASDQQFETDEMDFGRGTLIIRYTDYNNVVHEPTIYTNYLEANAMVGADTKVQLFEEGDYEVALDYEVTDSSLDAILNSVGHYRIYFTFSVRNGNCMVYPFDVVTGEELTNSSWTENGFRLDLANSRYLSINLKREVLKDSADGLVEDTRFNGPARDGAEYTDEGIYTITVSNQYTGQSTAKKIYVGTNDILRCYVATGLSISEINELVADGAIIEEDGTIMIPEPEAEESEEDDETAAEDSLEEGAASAIPDESVVEEDEDSDDDRDTDGDAASESEKENVSGGDGDFAGIPYILAVVIVILLGGGIGTFLIRRKRHRHVDNTDDLLNEDNLLEAATEPERIGAIPEALIGPADGSYPAEEDMSASYDGEDDYNAIYADQYAEGESGFLEEPAEEMPGEAVPAETTGMEGEDEE